MARINKCDRCGAECGGGSLLIDTVRAWDREKLGSHVGVIRLRVEITAPDSEEALDLCEVCLEEALRTVSGQMLSQRYPDLEEAAQAVEQLAPIDGRD